MPALSVWAHAGERVAQAALQQMDEVDELFCDGCIEVAQAALQQMGQALLPLPEAVAQVVAQGAWGVLVRALPHEAVRAAVVELGTPAVSPLIQALGDEDEDVRVAACRALGQIGDPQALPRLIQALEDEYKYKKVGGVYIGIYECEYVRRAAREAVEQIKAKQCARNEPLD